MADGSTSIDDQTTAPDPEAEGPKKVMIKKKPVGVSKKAAPREQSTIQFPYMDLEVGISVVQSFMAGGGVPLTREQLGGVMGLSATSGNFVMKIATARLFGLIAFNQGKYELTDLGFAIVDTDDRRQRGARATAFLKVPLYSRTYEEFRGKQLPPRPHGLEQAFVKFGVAQKQKTNARLAFDKSAKQAGFFSAGQDRLIEPIIGGSATSQSERRPTNEADVPEVRVSEPQTPERSGLHPFIEGLLATLPEPHTNWAIEGRTKWLSAAANIFDLIYKGDGTITISVKLPEAETPSE